MIKSARLLVSILFLGCISELLFNPPAASQSRDPFAGRRGIPPASLACTPQEAEWWDRLRAAGDAVTKSRGSKKSRKAFADLLLEGESNKYQPPVANQKPIVLMMSEPEYTEEGRKRQISGDIELLAEFLPNGTLGRTHLRTYLGSGLDENAETAARKVVFLPAVKDRKFVSTTLGMLMTFQLF